MFMLSVCDEKNNLEIGSTSLCPQDLPDIILDIIQVTLSAYSSYVDFISATIFHLKHYS